MKGKIKNLIVKWKESERGALIVESTIVFPVMFFVLLFIIFIGNTYFEISRVNDIVMRAAISGAQYAADPFLYDLKTKNAVPTEVNGLKIEPYRYLLGSVCEGGISATEDKLSKEVEDDINSGGMILLANCSAEVTGTDNEEKIAQFDNHVIAASFTVQVNYEIRFPIRFIGESTPPLIEGASRAEVPVSDADEFIRNVDMAIDLLEDTALGKSIGGLFQKVNGFIIKFADK